MKKFRTHSDTLKDIGREDVAEALDKKKFKEKLLGKELGKEVTKEALAQYQEDRLLNYIDNVKFKYSKQPIVEEPVTYNSTIGQFQKGNKLGALSDFKDDLKKDDDFKKSFTKLKKFYNEKPGYKEEKVFQNILPLNKKKKMSDTDLMYAVASPQDKALMRKDYKDYDFVKREFKEDNKFNSDFETAKRKAYQVLTTPEVKPEVTKEPVVQQRVIPQEDIAITIRRKADETLLRQQKEYAKEYGVHGIASLGKPQ